MSIKRPQVPPPPPGPAVLTWTGTRFRWLSPAASGLVLTGQYPDPIRWTAPAAGGGGTNHATLSNLAWTASGHTGTASTIAAFSGAGAAAGLTPIPEELRISGTDLGIALNAELPGTGSVTVPIGSTAQRPGAPTVGMIRWNSTIADLEYYDSGTADWRQVANDADINSAIGQAVVGDSATLVYAWARQSFGFF